MGRSTRQRENSFILLNASWKGHVDCVNACLAAGADVNFETLVDHKLMTRLLDEYVEALIKAGGFKRWTLCGLLEEKAVRNVCEPHP